MRVTAHDSNVAQKKKNKTKNETSDQEYADLSFYCYLTKLRYLVKSAAGIDRVRYFATKGLEQFDHYPEGVRPVAKNMYFEAMVVLMGHEKASVSSEALL